MMQTDSTSLKIVLSNSIKIKHICNMMKHSLAVFLHRTISILDIKNTCHVPLFALSVSDINCNSCDLLLSH